MPVLHWLVSLLVAARRLPSLLRASNACYSCLARLMVQRMKLAERGQGCSFRGVYV